MFWNDQGGGVDSASPVEVDLEKAKQIWSDDVDDAGLLEIVNVDFPCPEEKGSYMKRIRIIEVYDYIDKALKVGADPKLYDVKFKS